MLARRALLGGVSAAVATKAIAGPTAPYVNPLANDFVPALDDPNNASGLGAPNIIRGTVYGHNAAGLVVGAGQTTLVRQGNATALQSAITYAAQNGKFFELIPGVYEINSSTGLLIPAQGSLNYTMTWRGSETGTVITQFYNGGTGAPVLTIGDVTSAGTVSNGLDIYGMTLGYGADQTGLTSSFALQIGTCASGKIGGINISGSNAAYDGIEITSANSSGGNYFFSMFVYDIYVKSVQRNMINVNMQGTGNVLDNIYLSNGALGSYTALTGNYLQMSTTYGTNEWTFTQLNCEGGACNNPILTQANIGIHFQALHMEGIKLTGSDPKLFSTATSNISIDQWDLVDLVVQSANFTGTPYLVQDYVESSSNIKVRAFSWVNNNSGQINTPMHALGFAGGSVPDQTVTQFTIEQGLLKDQTVGATFFSNIFVGNWQFDNNTPVSGSAFLAPYSWSKYEYGIAGSKVSRPVVYVSAAYTHYGQYEDAIIELAATGTYNITLADTMGATGTQVPRTGNTVTFVRHTYTSGTVTIKDGGGSTITTAASTTKVTCQFTGTAWATMTPIN